MKQPQWKTWLSFLYEIVLERGASNVNPDLQLGYKKGRYILSTPNAIYSYGDLYDNFTKSFRYIKIQDKPIQDVLVLGFGLGSVPYMLETKFNRKYNYTGIEADEQIVEWVSQYVLDELRSPIQINVADALFFTEICEQKFDLITMDIFIDNQVPEEFETAIFLRNLKNLLNEDGLLMYNRLTLTDLNKQETNDFYQNTFKNEFPNGNYIDLGGNWMLFSH